MSHAAIDLNGTVVSRPTFMPRNESGAAKILFTVRMNPTLPDGRTTQSYELDVQAWSGMAESIDRHITRGCKVTVTGRLIPGRGGALMVHAYTIGLDLRTLDAEDDQERARTGDALLQPA